MDWPFQWFLNQWNTSFLEHMVQLYWKRNSNSMSTEQEVCSHVHLTDKGSYPYNCKEKDITRSWKFKGVYKIMCTLLYSTYNKEVKLYICVCVCISIEAANLYLMYNIIRAKTRCHRIIGSVITVLQYLQKLWHHLLTTTALLAP